MHPDVCRYISSAFYEDRLVSAEGCAAQGSSFGTGLRFLEVEREGNSTSSEEEASAIYAEIELLLGGTWTDSVGVTQPITPADVMVVAPFNAQVKLLTERLQPGVKIGRSTSSRGSRRPSSSSRWRPPRTRTRRAGSTSSCRATG
jgi:superfamily I DNA and/or RNA helicase